MTVRMSERRGPQDQDTLAFIESDEGRNASSMLFHHTGHFLLASRFNEHGQYDGVAHLTKAKEYLDVLKAHGAGQCWYEPLVRLSEKLALVNFDEGRNNHLLDEIGRALDNWNVLL